MSELNLLPCPFCGQKPHVHLSKKKNSQDGESYQDTVIECKCGVVRIERSEDVAVEIWNTRTSGWDSSVGRPLGCKCQTYHHKMAPNGRDECNPEMAREIAASEDWEKELYNLLEEISLAGAHVADDEIEKAHAYVRALASRPTTKPVSTDVKLVDRPALAEQIKAALTEGKES